ncbi:MAG: hypothetical protein ACYDH9_12585 [Limisphaerales bacterium]
MTKIIALWAVIFVCASLMILYERALGFFTIPVLVTLCCASFFAVKSSIEAVWGRFTPSTRERTLGSFLLVLVVSLGVVGFVVQILTKLKSR